MAKYKYSREFANEVYYSWTQKLPTRAQARIDAFFEFFGNNYVQLGVFDDILLAILVQRTIQADDQSAWNAYKAYVKGFGDPSTKELVQISQKMREYM